MAARLFFGGRRRGRPLLLAGLAKVSPNPPLWNALARILHA
jgi:hypothetical protein